MLENYSKIRSEWQIKSEQHHQNSADYEDILQKCEDKFDQAKDIIDSLAQQV